MRFSARMLTSLAAVTITCVISAAAYYYKTRDPEINEVMVFCKLQYNVFNSFDKLMSYVDGAKNSIDVCMPGIHSPAIQARLVNALKRKIKLRIIIDRKGYRESTEFFIKELVDAGAIIKCRVNEPLNKQHKFCVVDGKILLTGTLNWGDDRTSDSWNYAYITNRTELVEPVKTEFDRMWSVVRELEQALKLTPKSEYETDGSLHETYDEISDEPMSGSGVGLNHTISLGTAPNTESLLESQLSPEKTLLQSQLSPEPA